MAHTKQRMAREIKRAGQIERTGLVHVVSEDAPANDWFSEADWLAADLALNENKAAKAHARNDADAMDLQVQFMREHGAL